MSPGTKDIPSQDGVNTININNNPKEKATQVSPSEHPEMEFKYEMSNNDNSNENRNDKFQRWHFWVQVGLFLATIGAFGAAVYYAHVASLTLDQIKSQTESVKTGAEAAKSAAKTAKNTLDQNKDFATNTLKEMKKSRIESTNLTKQGEQLTGIAANAAKKSADIAEKTMIGTQRPWVSVRLNLWSGLKFDEQGGHVSIVLRMKNVGNSPAVGTHVDAEVVLGFGPKYAIAEQKRMLATRQKAGPRLVDSTFGYMLFPGEEFLYEINFLISREQIKKYQTEMSRDFKKDRTIFKFINPNIVGCVIYGFSFDESVHKTGFIGEIFTVDPLHPNGRYVIDSEAGDVPLDLLTLHISEFGSYAD
jgi:hypothetical protein